MTSKKLLRATWLNCAVIAGIIVGFSSSGHSITAQAMGRVAVFFFALSNFLFLEVQPRLAKNAPEVRRNLYSEAWAAVAERPLISVLVLMQLWAGSRSLGTVIAFGREYSAPQVTSQNLQGRVMMLSAAMLFVGLLWISSAVGIWSRRPWAWWLALVLNGVDAGTTLLIQLFAPTLFLVDPVAVLAIVLLLLPKTRLQFRAQTPFAA